jgi:hypothetical protein
LSEQAKVSEVALPCHAMPWPCFGHALPYPHALAMPWAYPSHFHLFSHPISRPTLRW